jgi:hypothetical protein
VVDSGTCNRSPIHEAKPYSRPIPTRGAADRSFRPNCLLCTATRRCTTFVLSYTSDQRFPLQGLHNYITKRNPTSGHGFPSPAHRHRHHTTPSTPIKLRLVSSSPRSQLRLWANHVTSFSPDDLLIRAGSTLTGLRLSLRGDLRHARLSHSAHDWPTPLRSLTPVVV